MNLVRTMVRTWLEPWLDYLDMNLTLIVLVKWSGRGRWCGEVPRFAANYIVQLRHTGGKKGGEGYIVMYVMEGPTNWSHISGRAK